MTGGARVRPHDVPAGSAAAAAEDLEAAAAADMGEALTWRLDLQRTRWVGTGCGFIETNYNIYDRYIAFLFF